MTVIGCLIGQVNRVKSISSGKNQSKIKTVAIIELGAGISGCSVRGENRQISGQLIRINPTDAEGNDKTVSIKLGALEALLAIDKLLTH